MTTEYGETEFAACLLMCGPPLPRRRSTFQYASAFQYALERHNRRVRINKFYLDYVSSGDHHLFDMQTSEFYEAYRIWFSDQI